MELKLQEDPTTRSVTDYDFYFESGVALPVQVDEAAGDTIDFTSNPAGVTIHRAAQPSQLDPTQTVPSEDLTIFSRHVLFIRKSTRLVNLPTQEQREAYSELLKEITTKTRH